MNAYFSFRKGILEYTAKILVETALPSLRISCLEDADYIFVFNKSFSSNSENEICVFKEEDDSTFLVRVMEEVKRKFSSDEIISKFSNLEIFAKCYHKIEVSDLISDVVLSYQELNIDVLEMSNEQFLDSLNKNVYLSSKVDDLLGVKLHLYANHTKLESYYRWLRYKFKNLYMYKNPKCGNKFFTQSEVNSFYRSLAAKVKYINDILSDNCIEIVERSNLVLGKTEKILIVNIPYNNRALNEVLLKSSDDEDMIVCCKSQNSAVYSYWVDDCIVHKVLGSKYKVDRLLEYIEPISR